VTTALTVCGILGLMMSLIIGAVLLIAKLFGVRRRKEEPRPRLVRLK
jgi:hypothetical protein